MAYMLNSTLVPALALAASLDELASMLERTTDLDYLSHPRADGSHLDVHAGGTSTPTATIGNHVADCLRQVGAVLGHRIDRGTLIACSRQRGLLGLRAAIRELDATATFAATDRLVLEPGRNAEGPQLRQTAARGRDLALLLQHVRHHKAQVVRLMATAPAAAGSALCAS